MRIIYSIENWDNDSKKVLTLNWKDARASFMKESFDAMNIYFKDLEKKGNFNERFHVWKKIGRFGIDEGIWIEDCRNKRKKEKCICELAREFPEDGEFLLKYITANETCIKR